MDWAMGEAILHGGIPTAVLGVAAAGHCAVVADVGKGIAAAGRIEKQHRVGTERALATEGHGTEILRRYTGIDLVIEGLARARAVDGIRIAAPGKTVVDGLGG